jgi:hypothetical protein
MNIVELKEWRRTDKILAAICTAAILIAVTYTSIVLLDPYYGPCEYQYVASGKCQDNRAWHIQEAIVNKIHTILPS